MKIPTFKLAFTIAKRYFGGKKSIQAINIISWISMGAIAVSSAAMIILFSIFNGLENEVKELFTAFYPDLKVSKENGKFFNLSEQQKKEFAQLDGVSYLSYSLEDMVLLANEEEQRPAILKGVDQSWFAISGMDSLMLDGEAKWDQKLPYDQVLIGLTIASALRVDTRDAFASLNIYYPRSGSNLSQNPESALSRLNVKPTGMFHIQDEFDGQFVLTPLSTAQKFLERPNQFTSVEIKTSSSVSEAAMRKNLEQILGEGFKIENRFQQNRTLFMIMQSEKWAVYFILLMVLIIASFNMIGSLSMLVLEKRKDIVILKSMGATPQLIRYVFLIEGGLVAFVGGIIGISVGFLVCLGQMYFGWVELPDGFAMSAYPVAFQLSDFLLVALTTLIVGLLAAWYPAAKAAKQPLYLREE